MKDPNPDMIKVLSAMLKNKKNTKCFTEFYKLSQHLKAYNNKKDRTIMDTIDALIYITDNAQTYKDCLKILQNYIIDNADAFNEKDIQDWTKYIGSAQKGSGNYMARKYELNKKKYVALAG